MQRISSSIKLQRESPRLKRAINLLSSMTTWIGLWQACLDLIFVLHGGGMVMADATTIMAKPASLEDKLFTALSSRLVWRGRMA